MPADREAVADLARTLAITVGERVEVDGTDVTEAIRGPEVSGVVSVVAANPGVRSVLVQRQRQWVAEHGGGVVEGRDIGSVVFPDAEVKIYLTASPDERARRRPEEGSDALSRRDTLDSTRSVSPLGVADGARVIDTTDRRGRGHRRGGGGVAVSRNQDTDSRGRSDAEVDSGEPGACRVDTSFTPIYRFLRVLVHLLNRLCFRTTVEGADRVPATGPVIIAPVHRSFIDFFVASEVTRRKLHYMAKDSLWKNQLAGPDPPRGRRLPRPPGVG